MRALVTTWGQGDEPLESQYGTVTYREWCALETDRINAASGRQRVRVVERSRTVAIALTERG